MTGFGAGALPDSDRSPDGETRGTAILLAGLDETVPDFDLLAAQLLLAGFRVQIFDDVSVDTESSRLGVVHLIADRGAVEPLILIGSDLGAVLVAGLVAEARVRVSAVVLGNIVTSASRPSTLPPADFRAQDPTRPVPEHRRRLPAGVRLAEPQGIPVPALVFHGDDDDVTEVADAVSWASQLPFGSLRLVPGGDHHVLTGEARRTIAASVVLFVERQRKGTAVLVDGFASGDGRTG